MIRNTALCCPRKTCTAHSGFTHNHDALIPNTACFISLFSTAVDCGALSNLTNGQVDHTAGKTFEQAATYSCNTGYNLVGDSTHTCQATGEWSGSAPTCERMFLCL